MNLKNTFYDDDDDDDDEREERDDGLKDGNIILIFSCGNERILLPSLPFTSI